MNWVQAKGLTGIESVVIDAVIRLAMFAPEENMFFEFIVLITSDAFTSA